MKLFVLSVLCLCSIAYGYEPSYLSRTSSYASSRWRTSRYRPSSTLEASRLSSSPYTYDIHTSAAIRKPKKFDTYVPVLNTVPTNDVRSLREFSLSTTGGGLRSPSRKAFSVNTEISEAEKHFIEMEAKTRCALPTERVVCVQDHYPDADVVYRPACTILHRCDRHSGCCQLPKTCQPASSEQVTLLFQTSDTALSVLKLPFTNHTSCRCDIEDDIVHPTTTTTAVQPTSPETAGREIEEFPEVDFDEDVTLVGDTGISCPRCPRPFNKRVVRGLCQCDCFDGDSTCKSVKNGRQNIAEKERRCVQLGSCNRPTCGAGYYFNLDFGECRRPTYEKLALDAEVEPTTTDQAEMAGSEDAAEKAADEDANPKKKAVGVDDKIETSHRRHQRRHHKKHA
ncbi:hypothetical protein BIW11_14111 [Tropilaelaps mercedesae]|uniref:Platelet-derived growth factor (PDGF) family profile domain-containing protein n=1 Tax=Tropilaelaps mercedesae TaxID=418985 RepID=A0A1V9WZG5_9ACAR|nr:hypothetical protein BIW11_14111 [Tropilaelaps mercedesae]